MKRILKGLKKYFIPHEGNDHKPHLLRPQTVAFVIIVAFVMESIFLFGSSFLAPRSKLFGIIVLNALVDETNQERTANNLATLRVNPLLQAAAQEKADDMIKNNYFAHTSPAGVTPWYWFQNAGYNFVSAGENLAVNFSDSQDVTNAWMNSPAHRANILNIGFTEIGMATAQGQFEGRPAIYVVQLFGTPAVAPLAFVNTAAASAQSPAPAKTQTPITKPVPIPVTSTKSTPIVSPSVVVATGSETFVAIKGAEIQVGGATQTTTPPVAVVTQNMPAPAPESNLIQKAAADPRRIADYFYLAIVIIFGAALLINVFMKIHLQHPQLIMGGMLVVLVAGLFIILNQHVAGLNTTIL